jgi:hypothetical protein
LGSLAVGAGLQGATTSLTGVFDPFAAQEGLAPGAGDCASTTFSQPTKHMSIP